MLCYWANKLISIEPGLEALDSDQENKEIRKEEFLTGMLLMKGFASSWLHDVDWGDNIVERKSTS